MIRASAIASLSARCFAVGALGAGLANRLASFSSAVYFVANDVFTHDGIAGYVTVGKGHP